MPVKVGSNTLTRPNIDLTTIKPIITANLEEEFKRIYDSLSETIRTKLGRLTKTTIITTSDGQGHYKLYAGGIIQIHPNYGEIVLYGKIFSQWKDSGLDTGPLGIPRTNIETSIKSYTSVTFERGIIYTNDKVTWMVKGWIYARYFELNKEKGVLGFPKGIETNFSDGTGSSQDFQNGTICYTQANGASALYGEVEKKWTKLGGIKSTLGKPISGISDAPSQRGQFARFENGAIYYRPANGTFAISGKIRQRWEECGGANGWLGYPVSDELTSPNGQVKYNNFDNGIIALHPVHGAVDIQHLEFYMDRFGSKGSDRWGLGGGQDVYVNAKITTSRTNIKYEKRLPNKGNFGSSEEIDSTWLKITSVKGNDWINVYLKGTDEDDANADDHLGTIQGKYTIDNLWGIFDDSNHWNGDFQAVYAIKPIIPLDDTKPFRNQYWWAFNNFSTAELSKDLFAQTFRDVYQDEEWWLNPFNAMYYETAYKGVAKNGNCFGMCLEGIYAKLGKSVFAQPIFRWGPRGGEPNPNNDKALIREINMKHGYQVGASCIDWAVGQFISGNTHNPLHAYSCARSEFNAGNYPLLVVTPSYWKIGAHAVLPYKFAHNIMVNGRRTHRIYVADPNVEWTHSRGLKPGTNQPEADPTWIDIDIERNEFSYVHGTKNDGSPEIWSGGEWEGGRFYRIPFSWLDSEPRTPFWEIMALLTFLAGFIIAGDADSEQISDQNGKNFYKPNLGRIPDKHSDINPDVSGRMPNTMRLPLIDADNSRQEVYFRRGIRGGSIKHNLVGRAQGAYSYLMSGINSCTYAKIGTMKNDRDIVTNNNISLKDHAIEFTSTSRSKVANLGVKVFVGKSGDYRVIEALNLPAEANRPVTMQFNEAKDAVIIDNKGADANITVRMETRIGKLVKSRVISNLSVKTGKALRIQPQNWSAIASSQADCHVLSKINGTVLEQFKA